LSERALADAGSGIDVRLEAKTMRLLRSGIDDFRWA
jgi:hypothetical protein